MVAGNALPLSAVETTIKSILTRINYGLDAVPGRKHPAAACVWRWEVIDDSLQGLPEKAKEKAQARRQERVAVREQLLCNQTCPNSYLLGQKRTVQSI